MGRATKRPRPQSLQIAPRAIHIHMRTFMQWLVSEELHTMDAEMGVPRELEEIARIMRARGKTCYVVGGAVRDHLFNLFHGMKKNINDYDLATDALPEETRSMLDGVEIDGSRLEIFDKGADQGVLSIIVKDQSGRKKDEFEIATFRREVYSGSSRRPERTEFGATPEEDTQRRDLNYNSLFYDPIGKKVKDYNSGRGIEDIRSKRTSVVGDPYQRFFEDKLRVLRVVRFFNRYNDGDILSHIDEPTRAAISEFKDLPGVSRERINKEFLSGLKQSMSPANFVKSLVKLDLIRNVLPHSVRVPDPGPLDDMGGELASMMSYILSGETPNRKLSDALVGHKFEYVVITPAITALRAYRMFTDPGDRDYRIHEISREIKRVPPDSIMPFMRRAGFADLASRLYDYKPRYSGSDVAGLGLRGRDISDELDRMEKENFFGSRE